MWGISIMSGSYWNLLQKYNSLLSLFNQYFPYPPSPYPPPADVMTLTTAQTASGLKTFSTLPQSSVTPTNANDLVNKTYADSLVPTPVNAVTIDGTQTLLTGIKTFTNLPACSAVPISGSQLVNKTYVDGLPAPPTPNLSSVLSAGSTANTSINMNGFSINNINTLNNIQAGLVYTPQLNLTAVSNAPIAIPVYGGDHQILLRASPVPVIDTLVQQTEFLSGGATVICSATGNGFQWLGTSQGQIYCYDSALGNWTMTTQFNGQINALHYCVTTDRLYIGGSFSSCNTPFSGLTYNNVAYISAPSTASIIPDNLIWSGNSNGGLNGICNAITEDGAGTIYFGGNFTQNADLILTLNYFGCYNQPTNVLTPIDNNSSNGFDSTVFNLSYITGSSTACATGLFTTLTSGGVPTSSPYCVVFTINGNSVSNVYQFDGGAGVLTVSIGGLGYYDLIDNDGTDFVVAIQEVYLSPSVGNLNYLLKVDPFGTASIAGSNAITNNITSFYRKTTTGLTHTLDTANNYYIDSFLATAMGNGYFVFNFNLSDTVYFNLQTTNSQWAFVGSSANNFLFGGGRQLKWYNGALFSTGYNVSSPVSGSTLLLNWNGTYYVQVCSLGSSWGPYT